MIQIESGVNGVSAGMMRGFKQAGFSGAQIGGFLDMTAIGGGGGGGGVVFLLEEEGKRGAIIRPSEGAVRRKRVKLGVRPVVKQIAALAGEYSTKMNCLYMMYHGTEIDALGTGIDVVGGTWSNVVEDKHSSIAAGRGGIMVLGNEVSKIGRRVI